MGEEPTKQLDNENGVVLVTVVIITLTLMILAVALMSVSVSQSISGQHQIDRIKAEELAKGAFWYNYMNLTSTGTPATPPGETLDGKPFTPAITSSSGGPNNTTIYSITVSYPR